VIVKPPTSPISITKTHIIAISFLVGVGALIFNIMPILLAAIGIERAYSDTELGDIGSAYFSGFTLFTVFAMVWVRRIDWRKSSITSLIVAAFLLALAAFIENIALLLLAFALLGIAMVFIYTPLLTCLGDTADPDRAMGFSLTLQVSLAAVVAFVLPTYVLPFFGLRGALMTLSLLCLLSLLLTPTIPRSGRFSAVGTPLWAGFTAIKNASRAPKIALLGILIFYIGITGLWTFVDRIAQSQGLQADAIGLAISASLLFGGVGALLPAILGARFGRQLMLILGLCTILGAIFLLSSVLTDLRFLFGVILLNVGWNMTVAYAAAQVAESDNTGFILPLIPAAISIGAAIAPALSGRLLEFGGSQSYFGVLTAITVIAYALLIIAIRAVPEE
jgi:MFS family permease